MGESRSKVASWDVACFGAYCYTLGNGDDEVSVGWNDQTIESPMILNIGACLEDIVLAIGMGRSAGSIW